MRNPVLAAARFGFGAGEGEIESLSGDARGALAAQLDRPPGAGDAGGGDLPTTGEALRARNELRENRKSAPEIAREKRLEVREIYRQEIEARFRRSIATDAPFRERLVQFWSNHFTV